MLKRFTASLWVKRLLSLEPLSSVRYVTIFLCCYDGRSNLETLVYLSSVPMCLCFSFPTKFCCITIVQ